jgi:Cu(I)/Ag(I) efflux system membrane fusion protein
MRTRVALALLAGVIGTGITRAFLVRGPVDKALGASRAILYYVDPMHPDYRSPAPGLAPDCGMALQPVYATGSRDASPVPARQEPAGAVAMEPTQRQLMGIEVAQVNREAGVHRMRAFAKVTPDERRVYTLLSGVDGIIREASTVTTGSLVRKGQVLATFSSPEVVAPIQSYVNAVNARQRLRNSASSTDDRDEAVQASVSAQQNLGTMQQTADRLRTLGVSDNQIEEIERTRQLPEVIRIVAPADGIVIAWQATTGLRFGEGQEWYRIADLRSVWILADMIGPDASALRPGMEGRVFVSGRPLSATARVSDVMSQFDSATQRLTVRLETDNPGLSLRPGMFVDVELLIPYPATIAVPVGAVVDHGLSKTVFVEHASGSFRPREVQTGWRSGGRIEIVSGLTPMERVVTAGAFFVESARRLQALTPPEAYTSAHAHH